MKKLLFLFFCMLLTAYAAQAQFYKNVEIKAGANLSTQFINSINEEPSTAFKSGWQLGLSKQWNLISLLFAELGAGISQNGSQVLTRGRNIWGAEFNTWEEARLRYAYLESGLNLRKQFGLFEPYAGATFRYGHKYNEEYSGLYRTLFFSSASTSDYGLNFKTGTSFKFAVVQPFVELSFYQGLHNLQNGIGYAYIDPEGQMVMSADNVIRNSALALQFGLRF